MGLKPTQAMTMTGKIGTPGYMAPEELHDGSDNARYSPAVDVFSFGISCVELWNGGPPYSDEQFAHGHQLIEFVRNGDRPSIGNNCPDDLADLIRRCWSENASERPLFSAIVEELIPIHERMKNSMTSDDEHTKLRAGVEEEKQLAANSDDEKKGSKESRKGYHPAGNGRSARSGSSSSPDENTPLI